MKTVNTRTGDMVDLVSDLFEFFEDNTYSDRMVEKMAKAIDEFRNTNTVSSLEFYEHYFFNNKGIIAITAQQWNKIVFSSNIIFNTILSKFLKIYTVDIYGSKIYQFNGNDATVNRNKVNSFFSQLNQIIIPFNYEKIDDFVHSLIKEAFDSNYNKRNILWQAFELSFLYSIFREVSEDLTIDTVDKKEEKKVKEVDILHTITDEERELVNSLLSSPVISKVFKRINSKKEYNEVVDEFIRISLIWARRDK